MSDEKKATDQKKTTDEASKDKKSGKWTTGAKVGAAVGSAAIAAALIYAGRHQMKKNEEKGAKPKAGMRYENEPELDDEGDLAAEYDGYVNDEEE
ncbi:hypothetical protein MNBD_ALPHA04-210 [hydrothermal vent metagenome]|uniref:Uncharacterized protein n=1 Tax=hydrothermal vent metagenome TaxID=652676 RepID=A0A3B0SE09_9ZZZZ